jgi:peptidoglycan/LPS O-acetylase OafA/YrhL
MTTSPEAPPAVEPDRFYRPQLDALRFAAFLSVFFHHFLSMESATLRGLGLPAERLLWITFSCQWGVDLFLVLSAYLITELLFRERRRFGTIDIKKFYLRRILRIWPLYYAFFGYVVLIHERFDANDTLSVLHLLAFATLAGNWTSALLGFPNSLVAILWTVSLEEQFYLVWPFIVRSVRRLWIVCLAMIVISSLMRFVLIALHSPDNGLWCNTLARLEPFAAGALVALGLGGGVPRLGPGGRGLAVAGGAALWLVGTKLGHFSFEIPPSWGQLLSYPMATAGASLFLLAALACPPESAFGSARALIYLGRISYGLYVLHFPAMRASHALLVTIERTVPLAGWSRLLASFGLWMGMTVALAAISYRWLERPFLSLKSRLARIPSRPVTGA